MIFETQRKWASCKELGGGEESWCIRLLGFIQYHPKGQYLSVNFMGGNRACALRINGYSINVWKP